MQLKRVVITGMGAISPYGRGVRTMMDALFSGRGAVRYVPELENIQGLRAKVASTVTGVDPMEIPRKYRRSMSAMSIFAVLASRDALAQAGIGAEGVGSGRLGISIGSTVGSTQAVEELFRDFFTDSSLERMKSTTFFHIMNHSCAANVAQALEITGRMLAPAAACATGSVAVGMGFETIALGKQDMMLCGGADEFHPLTSATFDIMNAAAPGTGDPEQKSRPFDRVRGGVVCGEGAGVLLLESLESAVKRNAAILAEIVGFATVSDPGSIANPNAESMAACMRLAMEGGPVAAEEVGYVNAHATGTLQGDIAESRAISSVFGDGVPVSSLKGHLGHTMAASGSLELIASVEMMRMGHLVPTLNLDEVDPDCAPLRYLREPEFAAVDVFIKNSFALGGVNSSLIVRRFV